VETRGVETNPLGLGVGPRFDNWRGAARPQRQSLIGRTCRLDPLVPSHAAGLVAAYAHDTTGANATYLAFGPFSDAPALEAFILEGLRGPDRFFAITKTDEPDPVGFGSYMRIQPQDGSIEIGNLYFAPALQRTTAATEAIYLMIAHAFDALGYRRVEWKCNALNAPSKTAALRFGFTFEGVFRQATVSRGRSRDTAWYSITDGEWPGLATRFRAWLSPENFDPKGAQIRRLDEI
ncbi:MAG: GNAT family protein, partial [Pseudomonadota bacterium]